MTRLPRIVLASVIGVVAVAAGLVAAEGAKPVTMTADSMKWVPNPDAPGVKTAVVWGDLTKAHGAFHKFEPGFTTPLHTHSANTKIVVVSGTMSMTGEDGKEMKLTSGSFYTQPNTYPHMTKCLAGSECLIYLEADAGWDLKPVEAKKK